MGQSAKGKHGNSRFSHLFSFLLSKYINKGWTHWMHSWINIRYLSYWAFTWTKRKSTIHFWGFNDFFYVIPNKSQCTRINRIYYAETHTHQNDYAWNLHSFPSNKFCKPLTLLYDLIFNIVIFYFWLLHPAKWILILKGMKSRAKSRSRLIAMWKKTNVTQKQLNRG